MTEDMFDEDGRREGRFVVGAGTPVSVTAGSDFEVEWTVYFVFFCSVDSGQSLRHINFAVDGGEGAYFVYCAVR